MISSSLGSDDMDVEIAGINNNSNHLHHNNNNNATETVYERIKMMLQTYKTTLPNPQYIEEIQQDNGFIPKWRYRTIQYMLTYHEIGLCDETLSLAINIFDRYLSKKSVGKQQIELICVVAMMLASKLIENDGNYFRVEEVVGAVKNTTEKEQHMCMRYTDKFKISFTHCPAPMGLLTRGGPWTALQRRIFQSLGG